MPRRFTLKLIPLGSGSAPDASQAFPEGRTARKARRTRKITPTANPALSALTEAQFQRIVRAHLERRGYVVWVFPIMKRTMAGVPDLTFWHPSRPGVLHAWELKRETRYVVSPAQAAAIAHLATVPGIDARIVKPSDWPALRDELEPVTPSPRAAADGEEGENDHAS